MICIHCHREVIADPGWLVIEDAYRERRFFCSMFCLFNFLKFYVESF